MKIIYLTSSINETDGWSRYAYDVITRMNDVADVSVLCHEAREDIAMPQKEVLRLPIKYLFNPAPVFLDLLRVRKAIKEEAREDDEEVIIHFIAEGYAMFTPFLWGIDAKTVMTIHGTYSVLPFTSWKTSWLYKLMYKKVGRVISVSHYTKKHLLENASSVSASKVKVMTNGVDFEKREIKGKKEEPYRILCVGSVKPRKAQLHLARVAKILKDQYNFDFEVVCAGSANPDSGYVQQIRNYVQENDLEGNFSLLGRVSEEELQEQYRNADLFALLSVHENYRYEGYPLVFHEAAMWGLPTVGTFNCGAEDAIKDGETGVLVSPYEHETVAQKMVEVLTGEVDIDPRDCQEWARKNDWDNKDISSIYSF